MIIISLFLYLVFISIFIVAPLPVQIILALIDIFVPDPIPVLDELIMIICLFKKLATLGRIADFVEEHPKLSIAIVIAAIFLFNCIFDIL